MATKYLFVNKIETSGRVTSYENQLTVNMGGLDYDSVKIASISFTTTGRKRPPVVRLLGTEGHSTDQIAGAVMSAMNVIVVTNDTPSETIFIPNEPAPDPTFPPDPFDPVYTIDPRTMQYYYTSDSIHPCVHDLHSRQHLTFQFSESDGAPITIADINTVSMLLELN